MSSHRYIIYYYCYFILTLQNTSSVQESSEEMSPLVELARESIILFSDIFTGKLDSTRLGDVQNWIRRSETVLKPHDTESVVEDRIIERAPCDLPLTREWMSNGVWNVSCVKYFKCKFHFHSESYIASQCVTFPLYSARNMYSVPISSVSQVSSRRTVQDTTTTRSSYRRCTKRCSSCNAPST